MLEIKTLDQFKKIVLGATIMGTGGGGDPEEGFSMIKKSFREGSSLRLLDVTELSSDGIVVVPYYVGTVAPGARTKKPVKIKEPMKRAFKEMENLLGKKIVAVAASELGGGNTSVAISIALDLGLPMVDGDLLGRAAPELHQCTVHIYGIPMYPAAIVTETGDVVIIKEYADIDDYEALARYVSVLSGRFAAVVDTPMGKEDAEKALVKGTISLTLRLGEEVLKARSEGRDPIEAVVRTLEGWKVFEGVISKYDWRDEAGFLKGEAEVDGVGKFAGHKLRTWLMNEHIMVWLDGEPLVMPPDLFMLLRKDGEPVTNTELKEGMHVVGVAAKAADMWRTPQGLKYFGPRRFGFNYDYVPVEKLVAERVKP